MVMRRRDVKRLCLNAPSDASASCFGAQSARHMVHFLQGSRVLSDMGASIDPSVRDGGELSEPQLPPGLCCTADT